MRIDKPRPAAIISEEELKALRVAEEMAANISRMFSEVVQRKGASIANRIRAGAQVERGAVDYLDPISKRVKRRRPA